MQKRQRFTAEFKREAIRLMKTSTKPATALARELDVPRNRLYKWAQDAEKKGDRAFQGSGRPKASTDELSVLQRCREVRMDQDAIGSFGAHAVCRAGCLDQRLLRLPAAPTERSCHRWRSSSAADRAHPHRESRGLRHPADWVWRAASTMPFFTVCPSHAAVQSGVWHL